MQISIYAGDHAPPHFKIYGPGSNANVVIEALEWASHPENRALLRATWNKLNEHG